MLTTGTKLGPYEIQAPLGSGGMGEVYRARDTRLDRTVAIKVLPGHLSQNVDLRQRFEREARAISSLQHPHICVLHDIGHEGGIDYLVMEYLEGETVAERLRRGALPFEQVLEIGRAIADALDKAHRQGIIHRDLKPGNIMLTKAGAKLMDFGLAKPLAMPAAAGSGAPSFTAVATLTSPSPVTPLTTAGTVVGTIQYMAPEQIEGKEADARSDLFSLGAVLYEMVTGKRAFEGKSQISVASSILEKDPEPISTTKPLTPPVFEQVVKTCLEKNPEDRFQTAHDVKLALRWIQPGTASSAAAAVPMQVSGRQRRLVWLAVAALALFLGAGVGYLLSGSRQPARIIRSVIAPPDNASFRLEGDFAGPPVLSPDGSTLAFAATGSDGKAALWVRPLDSLDARVLPGTEGAIFPFWSPDSRSLGFFADGKLKTIDLGGGAPLVICDAPQGRGGTWGPGALILFTPDTQAPILRVSASGGTPTPVTKIDSTRHTSHRWPFFLPDGKHFLYLALNHNASRSENDAVYFASLDGAENRPLLRSLTNAIYANGFILCSRSSRLSAQRFDPSSGNLSGEIQNVASGVAEDISTWHLDASASDTGQLVFGSGGSADWQLIWVDRTGKRVGTVVEKLPNLQLARISPQGDRIALQIDSGVNDVWVLDIARGVRTRLTFGPVVNAYPVWSPDGKWIAYASNRNARYQLYRKLSDGSGAEELLLEDNEFLLASDWSGDGKYLLYSRGLPATRGSEVWALPLQGERKPFVVIPHGANSYASLGSLSPDGHWLAYMSDESGQAEVYVVSFRGGPGKWQVSQNGGGAPRWSRDGKTLYYSNGNFTVVASPVKEVGGVPQFGTAQALATGTAAPQIFFYDVAPDGSKVLLSSLSQQTGQSIVLVSNWHAGLK